MMKFISKVRILVVDDEPSLIETVQAYLEEDGYTVCWDLDGPGGFVGRTALLSKQEVEARQAELKTNIENLDHQATNLKQRQINLEGKIDTFRSRVEELKAIYVSSQAQLRIREALTGISEDLADVDNTIQRAEARIQEMQSRADAIDALIAEDVLADVLTPGADDIERQLVRIGRSRVVDKELARLNPEMLA